MEREFVSLADTLRPPEPVPTPMCDVVLAEPVDVPEPASSEGVADAADAAAAVREARLFRARLADALDDATARLVRELAAAVLARELRLAPCDIDAVIRDVLRLAPAVRVRLAPSEATCVAGIPVVADPSLEPGDAIVELAGGAIDARFGVRLATVLEAFT